MSTIAVRERHPHFTDMPPYCASCASQKPGSKYIDFDSAFDGPVLNREDGIAMQIDDLIICEECLREAARLLNLVDPEQDSETLARAKEELLIARDRLAEADAYIEQLEGALSAKPGSRRRAPQEPKQRAPKKKSPQKPPQLQGPDDVPAEGDGAPDAAPGVVIERLT